MTRVMRAGLAPALVFGALVIGGLAGAGATRLSADASPPTVVGLLFESPHLDNLKQGAKVVYHVQRTVSDDKLLGQPFNDEITLDVKKIDEAGKREMMVQVFSGERAREPQLIADLTGNPVLVVFLDRCVKNFQQIAGGNPPYLKNQFRNGLGAKSKIDPVKIDYDGHAVDGYRVSVQPFAEDPNATKMQGYEGSKFSIVVSDAVPGRFVEMVSHYESTVANTPRLEERTTIAGLGGVK